MLIVTILNGRQYLPKLSPRRPLAHPSILGDVIWKHSAIFKMWIECKKNFILIALLYPAQRWLDSFWRKRVPGGFFALSTQDGSFLTSHLQFPPFVLFFYIFLRPSLRCKDLNSRSPLKSYLSYYDFDRGKWNTKRQFRRLLSFSLYSSRSSVINSLGQKLRKEKPNV